jgi:hypothetical protein
MHPQAPRHPQRYLARSKALGPPGLTTKTVAQDSVRRPLRHRLTHGRNSRCVDGTAFACIRLMGAAKMMQSSDHDDRRAAFDAAADFAGARDRDALRFLNGERLTWPIFCPQSAIAERACLKFQRGRKLFRSSIR